jgi:hypothetical protein
MTDPILSGLLTAVAAGDLNALLMLSDCLEERDDPRTDEVRRLYRRLYDDWMYAPKAFRHYEIAKHRVLRLFPEWQAETESKRG